MQGRRRLAVAAMLGAATFGVLEAIQSVARADHSFSQPMSVYAAGPYGFVQTVAFLVLAVGSAAVCAAIGLPHPRPPDWQVARGLIVVWSVGVSLAAAFRIEGSGSTAAQVHAAASMLSFLTVLAAMFFFTRATRQVPAWYSFGKVSSALASVAALAFVVGGATQPSIVFGVAQRVFLGAVVAWLVAVGARSYVLARDGNIEQLRRALDAYDEGELTPLAELLDPAVSWHGVHGQGIRPCSDRTAVRATMHSRFESGFRLDDVHLTEAGDQVIVKFHSPEGGRIHQESELPQRLHLRRGAGGSHSGLLEAGVAKLIQESVSMLYPDRGAHCGSMRPHPSTATPLPRQTSPRRQTPDALLTPERPARSSDSDSSTAPVPPTASKCSLRPATTSQWCSAPRQLLSSIHLGDAAAAVVAALQAPANVYNVVDDEPVTKRQFAEALAAAADTPIWFTGPGRAAVMFGDRITSITRSLRVSNRRLRTNGWPPRYPSVREG